MKRFKPTDSSLERENSNLATLKAARLGAFLMVSLSVAILTVIAFTVIISAHSARVLDTLNKQFDDLVATESVIFSKIEFSASEEFNTNFERKKKARLEDLLGELLINHKILLELESNSYFQMIFGFSYNALPYFTNEERFNEAFFGMQNLLTSSGEHDFISPDFKNGQIGNMLVSGGYQKLIIESIKIARGRHEQILSITYIALFALGLILILGIVVIQGGIVTPAVKKLITTHNRALLFQSKITKQKLLMETAFHSLPYIAAVLDRSGRLIVSNPPFNQLMHRSGQTLARDFFYELGQSIDAEKLNSLNSEDVIKGISEIITTGESFNLADKKISWSCTYIQGSQYMFVGHDNTELAAKQAEQSHHERLEAVGRLASGIAHDFNNILGGITLRAELALTDPKTKEAHGPVFEGFIESTMRAKSMISQLQSYSRKQTFSVKSVSAADLQTRLQLQLIAPPNITLKFERTSDVTIEIDTNFFVTAIENVTQNAIFAIGENIGEIKIKISDDLDSDENPYLVVEVEDTGGGFSEKALRSATEPFFTTKGPMLGSGLGLAMVAGFVAQNQGFLSIMNANEGAIVKLSFPVKHQTSEKQAPSLKKPSQSIAKRRSETFVLLEDDAQIGPLQQMYLEKHFSNVELYTNVTDCIDRLRQDTLIDFAMFDWTLPDGISDDAILLCHNIHPETKIIVSTGNIEAKLVLLADQIDICLLEKPIRLQELSNAINGDLRPETSLSLM